MFILRSKVEKKPEGLRNIGNGTGFEKKKLGTIFIVLGFLCILGGLFNRSIIQKTSYIMMRRDKLSNGEEAVLTTTQAGIKMTSKDPIKINETFFGGEYLPESIPVKIVIPSANIDIPIKMASVIDGKWEVFEDAASFGIGSYPLGMSGNSVIFAHAREKLFLPLRKVRSGDKIYLFSNSNWYLYEVSELKTVLPNDVSIIGKSDDERITLYTCSGFADLKRLVVVAKRVGNI